MKKRIVSLLLVISLISTMFLGLGVSASAYVFPSYDYSEGMDAALEKVDRHFTRITGFTHGSAASGGGSAAPVNSLAADLSHSSEVSIKAHTTRYARLGSSGSSDGSHRVTGQFATSCGGTFYGPVSEIAAFYLYSFEVSASGLYSFGTFTVKEDLGNPNSGPDSISSWACIYNAEGTLLYCTDIGTYSFDSLHLDAGSVYELRIYVYGKDILCESGGIRYVNNFCIRSVTLDETTEPIYGYSGSGSISSDGASPASGWVLDRIDSDGYKWYEFTGYSSAFGSSSWDHSTASYAAAHFVCGWTSSGISYSLPSPPGGGTGYYAIYLISGSYYSSLSYESCEMSLTVNVMNSSNKYTPAPGGMYASPVGDLKYGRVFFECQSQRTLTVNARFYCVVFPSQPEPTINNTYNYYNYTYNTPAQGSYTNGATTDQFIDIENQAVVVIKDDGSTETHSYTSGYFDVRSNTFVWENDLAGERGSVTYTDNGTIISVAGNGLTINYNYYYAGIDPSIGVSGEGSGGSGGGSTDPDDPSGSRSWWDWLKERFQNLLGGFIDTVGEWISSVVGDLLNGLWSLVKGIFNFFTDLFGSFGSRLSRFFDYITGFYDDSRVSWAYDGVPTPDPDFGDGSGEGGGGQPGDGGGGIQ